jgi:hypothetical protein
MQCSLCAICCLDVLISVDVSCCAPVTVSLPREEPTCVVECCGRSVTIQSGGCLMHEWLCVNGKIARETHTTQPVHCPSHSHGY